MPLIATVGRKSLSVRALLGGIYVLLLLGAVTMTYPFLLMVSLGTAGRGTCQEFRMVQPFWFNDTALFRRYLFDLVPAARPASWPAQPIPVSDLAHWFGHGHWHTVADVRLEDLAWVTELPAGPRRAMAGDMRDFMREACPSEFKRALGLFDPDSPLAARPAYWCWLRERYGAIANVNRQYNDTADEWHELEIVYEPATRAPGTDPRERDWREFVETRAPDRTGLFDADLEVIRYLTGKPVPPSFEAAYDDTGHVAYERITCDDLWAGRLGAEHRETFLRHFAPPRHVAIDTQRAAAAWRAFTAARESDTARGLALSERIPGPGAAGIWCQFIQKACPPDALRLERPEASWRAFLRERYGSVAALNAAYGTQYATFDDSPLPRAAFLYDNFLAEKRSLRWTYLTHNFKAVFEFVTLHGRALKVTLTYIMLAILGALTVNPLAAYGLSRFRLNESHHVLVFLLATMAFPAEVLMIPNFLLIKEFPLAVLLVLPLGTLGLYVLSTRLPGRLPASLRGGVALLITLALCGVVLPRVAALFDARLSVSLMNTYWALVLPTLANGYGIFLLKGFFDTLPPELYEAGLIDGAGELRMFWQITLPLCKPILAVMALNAFTHAYGAFMHAFLICQDPKMWTFMVFLYEFQQLHTVPMVMASLVVAAIPTLLVFIFCQRLILRGIVVPTFK